MRGYHVYKVLWSRALEKHSSLCAKLILNRDQLVKYLGFPLPELEIIYPICVKGCQKIRDAEFLEDVQFIFLCISENRFAQKNIFYLKTTNYFLSFSTLSSLSLVFCLLFPSLLPSTLFPPSFTPQLFISSSYFHLLSEIPSFHPFLPLSVLVLGFQPVNYTVKEGGNQVELIVVVLNGTIGSDITLSVTTSDGSAVGM